MEYIIRPASFDLVMETTCIFDCSDYNCIGKCMSNCVVDCSGNCTIDCSSLCPVVCGIDAMPLGTLGSK